MRVLLIASYCDENGCCEDLPCEECLVMCNVVNIPDDTPLDVIEGYDSLRDAIKAKEDNVAESTHFCCPNTTGCDECPYEEKCLGEEG